MAVVYKELDTAVLEKNVGKDRLNFFSMTTHPFIT